MLDTSRLDFRRAPVTMILLAVIVALEIFFNIRGPEVRNDFYNQWMGIWWQIWAGEQWRPLTSSIGHVNLIHALFNAYWLAVFGPMLEERFGSWRMLGLIVLLCYVSILPEYIVQGYIDDPLPGALGFSGVVYGLFGLILIGRRHVPAWWTVCDQQTVKLLIGWFFLCIFLTWAKIMPVANVAHGAGFGFGVLFGLAIFEKERRWLWIPLAVLLTAVVLGTMVACPGHLHYEHAMQVR
jgi:GlpG protein